MNGQLQLAACLAGSLAVPSAFGRPIEKVIAPSKALLGRSFGRPAGGDRAVQAARLPLHLVGRDRKAKREGAADVGHGTELAGGDDGGPAERGWLAAGTERKRQELSCCDCCCCYCCLPPSSILRARAIQSSELSCSAAALLNASILGWEPKGNEEARAARATSGPSRGRGGGRIRSSSWQSTGSQTIRGGSRTKQTRPDRERGRGRGERAIRPKPDRCPD